MIGSITKNGGITTAYKVGHKITLDYLDSFIPWEEDKINNFKYKSTLTLEKAKKKYPEWYERRIVRGEPKKKYKKKSWTIKRNLYDWWKKKIEFEILESHRYFGLMCLAIYAKKCGLTRDELKNDAFSLMPQLDKLTSSEDNHFTEIDVFDALKAFDDKYLAFPIDTISKLTAIPIQKNKRNYRKQKEHLHRARGLQLIDYPNGSWRNINGRPKGSGSKEKLVTDYLKENPITNVTKIAKALDVSRPTVYKYLDRISKHSR